MWQTAADRQAALLAASLEPQLIIGVLRALVRHPGALAQTDRASK